MPAKYEPRFCQLLIEHMSEGLSIEAFAGVIRVHKDTIYEWAKVHPEFKEAKAIGEGASRLYWERLGRDHIINESFGKDGGKSLNSSVWIYNMANRFGWRSRQPDEVPAVVQVQADEKLTEAQMEKLLKLARGDK
jgi:hypothetical protein